MRPGPGYRHRRRVVAGVMVVFLLFQRQFVAGIATTGLK